MTAPKLTLHRFYKGLPREDLVALWASALRSGKYTQGQKVLHRPSYAQAARGKNNGAFCVLGVLCHALDLPRKVVMTPSGMLFAYGDTVSTEPAVDNLPPELLRFLVKPNRSKLSVHLGPMVKDAPALFARIVLNTGLSREQLMRMEPTLSVLNDLGVSFGTMSLLVESSYW